jgi:hypothetical protein
MCKVIGSRIRGNAFVYLETEMPITGEVVNMKFNRLDDGKWKVTKLKNGKETKKIYRMTSSEKSPGIPTVIQPLVINKII